MTFLLAYAIIYAQIILEPKGVTMFTQLINDFLADSSVAQYYGIVKDYLLQYKLYAAIGAAVLILIFGLYGQRLFGLVRWLLVFAAGFVAGVVFAAPFIQDFAKSANSLLIGALCGLVLAVLSKTIYNIAYIGAIGYGVFTVCYNAMFIPFLENYTKGNAKISAVVAVAFVIIALLLRKYLEMILTAGLVGFGLPILVNKFVYCFTVFVPLEPMYTICGIGLIFSAMMFIHQFRRRASYI